MMGGECIKFNAENSGYVLGRVKIAGEFVSEVPVIKIYCWRNDQSTKECVGYTKPSFMPTKNALSEFFLYGFNAHTPECCFL